MYISPYGKLEGLSDRLRTFVDRLSTDRTIPFPGTGIIDDLNAAIAVIDGKPLPPTDNENQIDGKPLPPTDNENQMEWDL